MTNFPNGVSSFGIPIIGAGPIVTTGKVFFVHAGTGQNGTGRGTSPNEPLSTIDYAVGLCRANKNDTIIAMPGHTESITAAASIAFDVAGVSLYGLGTGTNRPTMTWSSSTSATITVTANNITIQNCIFDLTGVDAVITGFSITGTNCLFANNLVTVGVTAGQATLGITIGTAADRCRISNNEFIGSAGTAGTTAVISNAGTTLDVIIDNNYFYGDFGTAAINGTAAATNWRIIGNVYLGQNASEPIIELHSGTTGIIAYNLSAVATMAAAGGQVAAGCFQFQNFLTDTAANSGILDPTVVTL